MCKTTIELFFCIEGDFDPDQISPMISIQPTRTAKKGDTIKRTAKYKTSFWKLSSGEVETIDASIPLKTILSKLRPIEGELRKVKSNFSVTFRLSFYIILENQDSPILIFDQKTLDHICSLGASLDVDIVNSP